MSLYAAGITNIDSNGAVITPPTIGGCGIPPPATKLKSDGQRAKPAKDDVGTPRGPLVNELQARKTAHERGDCQLPFQPCKRATEADVGISSKRQVPIASPPNIELIRFLELARIALGSAYHERDGFRGGGTAAAGACNTRGDAISSLARVSILAPRCATLAHGNVPTYGRAE
jgi:hypothetical protein